MIINQLQVDILTRLKNGQSINELLNKTGLSDAVDFLENENYVDYQGKASPTQNIYSTLIITHEGIKALMVHKIPDEQEQEEEEEINPASFGDSTDLASGNGKPY